MIWLSSTTSLNAINTYSMIEKIERISKYKYNSTSNRNDVVVMIDTYSESNMNDMIGMYSIDGTTIMITQQQA
jgi:hypothetical protein